MDPIGSARRWDRLHPPRRANVIRHLKHFLLLLLAAATVVGAGATPQVEPHTAFWGGHSSYVADPDGHLWELAYNPYARLDDDGRLVMGEG